MKKKFLATMLAICMVFGLLPTAALAADLACTVTEGCTLEAGHEGDCVTTSGETEEPATPTVEEQLAEMIAALPDPEDIDPENETQIEAIHNQLSEIYAFANENGIDVEENNTINAVIAATWPSEAQVATTASGTDGGIDWSFANGVLTISAAATPETGFESGKMQDYTNQSADTVETPTDWYSFKDSITEVRIEEGVTYLGDHAFSYLTNAVKVNIPASITDLGDYIFLGNTALTTVDWADGFTAPSITDTDSNSQTYVGTYVPTGMFDRCTSLGNGVELSTWLPSSFTGVGCAAFRGTAFSVDFDSWSALTYIGTYGFAQMPNLTTVTIKSNWTFGLRGNNNTCGAFDGSGLKSVVISEGIESILVTMFQNCEQLTSVTLADSVSEIQIQAFQGTANLKTINLKNVATIASYAFRDSGLTSLVLPTSVETVSGRAFEGCASLAELTISAMNLTNLAGNSFAGCSSLKKVIVDKNASISSLSSGVFGPDSSYTQYTQSPVTAMEINGTVTTINLSGLSTLTDLTIDGKNQIKGDTLPSSLVNLMITGESWVFTQNYQFAKAALPKNLIVTANSVSVGTVNDKAAGSAFRYNTTLETAQFIGTTVTFTENMFMSCSNLKYIDLSQVETVTFASNCFGDSTTDGWSGNFNDSCVIYVKDETAAAAARTNTGLDTSEGIVLIVNGGTVDTTAETAGFGAVTKDGYTATWYEYDSSITEDSGYSSKTAVDTPKPGKTYIAVWTECNHNTKTYTAGGAVLTETCADCRHEIGTATIAAPTELTYDGSTKEATVTTSGWTGTVPTPVYYSGEAQLESAPTDAGTYSAKITADNVTASVGFTISKVTPELAIQANGQTSLSLTGGGTVTLTVDTSKLPAGATVSVSCDNSTYNPALGTDGKYTVALPNSDGTYTFTAAYAGDANHNEVSATCTVTVAVSYVPVPPVTPVRPVNPTPTPEPEPDPEPTPGVWTNPYADVSTADWYYDAVAYVSAKGLMTGTTASTFAPNDTMTRAMVWTVLARMEGQSVEGGSPWYALAQSWAVSTSVSDGTGSNDSITREQLVTMLYRQAGSPEVGVSELAKLGQFTDGEAVSDWAQSAMAWAVANGILTGEAGALNPQVRATRDQVAAILMRFCQQ